MSEVNRAEVLRLMGYVDDAQTYLPHGEVAVYDRLSKVIEFLDGLIDERGG